MTDLAYIEGIGPAFEKKLNEAGIATVEDFREKAATGKGRKELAAKTGIKEDLLLTWANHTDLYRIKGVGKQYADLLEAAGVDTVPELAQRSAANLADKLAEVNKAKKLVNKLPSASDLEDWIGQAKKLPKLITF